MDCWNFSINRILNDKWKSIEYDEEKIFSEFYPEVSLLPKIWKILLKVFPNVLIIHENNELFINIENEEEEELLNEYREELYNYMSKWWKFWCNQITIELLNEIISNNFYCIIPIKKGEIGSHFVVLRKDNKNNRKIIDNKKWEFKVNNEELEDLINIINGKYALFCWDYIKQPNENENDK
jgi:ABC-type bacteriocin/lantibiotic exporter with double-glycine peptidase domain